MEIVIKSGSYGWRKTKNAVPKLIERGGTCDVDEAEARRLVALGVAEIVCKADEDKGINADMPRVNMMDDEAEAVDSAEAHLDAEQLEEMTVTELKELAADLGLDTAKLRKKDDLIAAISAVPVVPGEEVGEDDLPDLSAAAPVV